MERGELWNRKGSSRDRRRIPEGFPRVVWQLGENQEFAVVYRRLVQCIDSQVVRYCGKESIKKAYRREKECGNAFLMR